MVLESQLKVKEKQTKQLESLILIERNKQHKQSHFEEETNEIDINSSETTDNFESLIESLILKRTKYTVESLNYFYQDNSNAANQ